MRRTRAIIVASLCFNLLAAAGVGYLVHRRGDVRWLAAKAGRAKKQARHIDTVTPAKKSFFLMVKEEQRHPVELVSVEGCPAFLILPADASHEPRPWVWFAPTLLPAYPNQANAWLFERFLDAGIAVAGIDVGESYGSPEGVRKYSQFHEFVRKHYGFSSRPCLLAQSRGGLMLYNWASRNPGQVKCIAGISPVCDLRSYPGLSDACASFGMSVRDLEMNLSKYNPIDELKPLAEARVPILHLHGGQDALVPNEANSGELVTRYRQLGGRADLIIIPNEGHTDSGSFFRNEELVEWVLRQLK